MHFMPKEITEIANLFFKVGSDFGFRVVSRRSLKQQRMPATGTHIFAMIIPFQDIFIRVPLDETNYNVSDSGHSRCAKNCLSTFAQPVFRAIAEAVIIHIMSEQ